MKYFTSFILVLMWISGQSQSLPLGFPVLEEQLRRKQMSGEFDPGVSFSIKPLKTTDTVYSEYSPLIKKVGKINLQILPVQLSSEYSSRHSYGINNGAMIPNRGYQGIFSPGIFTSTHFIDIQIKPEILFAQNKHFEGFPLHGHDRRWNARYHWWNRSDVPQRFGTTPTTKLLLGQSFLRFKYDFLSLGISTESIWWGPGKTNSLTMTNNAAGFPHVSLATLHPVPTAIGSFEGQLIAGKLENSGFYPPDTARRYARTAIYFPKHDDWRYLSGFALTYQPKWIQGLFFGFNNVVQQYRQTAIDRGDYVPAITDLFRSASQDDERSVKDHIASLHIRWAMQNSEIYFEYGRNNSSWKLRDLLENPENDGAYIFGFSKLFPLKKGGSFIELDVELTQLQQPPSYTLRSGGKSWYTHPHVRQGYTHSGEFLGSGIGSGSNMQTLGISWIRNLKKVGVQFERWTHNNDFYYFYFEHNGDFRSYWIDHVIGTEASWDFNKLLLSGEIKYIYSLNYQWETDKDPETGWFESGVDATNLYFSVDMAYRF